MLNLRRKKMTAVPTSLLYFCLGIISTLIVEFVLAIISVKKDNEKKEEFCNKLLENLKENDKK